MATALAAPKPRGNGRFERQGRSRLVPRLRRFWRARRSSEGAGRSADPEAQRGYHQRYRLFVQLPGFINTYGMHTLHGRALAVATGMKLANHDLTVLVTGGDGDGFGIGGNHFVHTMRRNVDLLYIVMDNQIYGLTTGQTSPTSRLGMKTKSMPFGNIEAPVNPISLALAAGATFVARGFSGEQKHLTELIKQGIQHKGFSFMDVFSPCVTYNHDNTYQWFRPRVKKLEDDSAYDPADWMAAMEKSLLWGDEIPIGKFFERTDVPTLHGAEPVLDAGPLAQADMRIPGDVTRGFVEELM